jgi:hypothetical protein
VRSAARPDEIRIRTQYGKRKFISGILLPR